MTTSTIEPALLEDETTLRRRLWAAGLWQITCDEQGRPCPAAPSRCAWIEQLLQGAPTFRESLETAAARWSHEAEPRPRRGMPGLWLVPVPLLRRRRRAGYSVTVIVTQTLCTLQYLEPLCRETGMGTAEALDRIEVLPPASEADVPRLATLIRQSHESHVRLTADTTAVESMGERLGQSYEEISLLYTIIDSMAVVEHPELFMAMTCKELFATLPYAWVGIVLAERTPRFERLAGRFIFAGDVPQPETSIRTLAGRLRPEVTGPMVLEPHGDARHAAYDAFGATALVHPVMVDGNPIGLFIAGDKQGEDTAASSVDMQLLGAAAIHTAIFLENAALYDDLNTMFLGTLDALTASIDAKDRYTCGHSRRVAHLTRQLAQAAELEDKLVSRTHIAGLVHDVGKIGVPERVLLKPGALDDEEFGWIRLHPQMGHGILKDIPQLEDVLPGVLHHHERWDGRGYPAGLAGEEIPLIGRLLSLADAFDAMSTDRTYRERRDRAEVLAEIRKNAGTQFDRELADVFVELDFSEFDELMTSA